MSSLRERARGRGFTLIEAIVVLVITGIIASIVAVFLQKPVQGYFDATRRAELADEADTALRRITRDLRLALPNSVRVTGSGTAFFLEFLLTKGGGRYRAEVDAASAGNPLTFGIAGTPYRFDAYGQISNVTPNSDAVVVYNLGPGYSDADAYASVNSNRRVITAASVAGGITTFTLTPPALVLESPAQRFQVVEQAVSYVCTPNAANPASGNVTRYAGYAIQAAQPTTFGGGSNALLANNIEACSFTYDPNAVAMRNGVVSVSITLSKAGEAVTLFQEAHVSNVP